MPESDGKAHVAVEDHRGGVAADAAHPTVIELFESQGCFDCPPANANLNAIAERPELLALNFAFWGSWSGAALTLAVPLPVDPAYRAATLIQQGKGGPIMAARRV